MPREIPENLRRRLLRLLRARSDEEADTDELASVLLQVSLAVMLIFMIAFFLFMSKVGGEINRVEDLKRQVARAERETVLRAVERVAAKYRMEYGLHEFLRIDPISGNRSYEFSGVIVRGDPVRSGPAPDAFRAGAAAARRDYAEPLKLRENWIRQVTELAGDSARRDPVFVRDAVRDAIHQLRREVVEVQTLAAAAVQEHFAAHPERVRDNAIRELLIRITRDPGSADRAARLRELDGRLRRYVYDHLAAQCGAPMLEVLP